MRGSLRILIVDDDSMMGKTLADIFRSKGYDTESANSGAEALQKVAEVAFDCVLTDIRMPDMDGVELCGVIKAKFPELLVVLMTAYTADEKVKQGVAQGAIAVLDKPVNINALLNFFSTLNQQRSIIIVDNDPQFVKTLEDILQTRSFQVFSIINDPFDVMEYVRENRQVILLDIKLNNTTGLEVLKTIRTKDTNIPVILITGYGEEMKEAIERALLIGAHTCLYKPFQMDTLIQTLTDIHQQELRQALGATLFPS